MNTALGSPLPPEDTVLGDSKPETVRPQVTPATTCRTSGVGACEFQLEGGEFCPGGRCTKFGEQDDASPSLSMIFDGLRGSVVETLADLVMFSDTRADLHRRLWAELDEAERACVVLLRAAMALRKRVPA